MPSPSRSAERLALALPALIVSLLYLPALFASFQFDDWNVIVNEVRVHSLTAWWESMPGIRPLLKLSYALNWALSEQPAAFRAVNVLVHALNATLVLWLLRVRGTRSGLDDSQALIAALFAALIFALHPVQTEAVTYISGRSSSLSACFCLLSLCCWVRSENAPNERTSRAWLATCGFAYVAAVATKETAAILPLALWLYSCNRATREVLKRLAPLVVLAMLMAIAAFSLPRYRHLLEVSLDTRSVGENILTQSRALLYLAGQLLRLGNGNADPQLPIVHRADLLSVALCMIWIVGAAVALKTARRSTAAFALLWFLLWLAPTNSVLPRLDVANDRQLYLAILGPAELLAAALARVQSTALRTSAILLVLALLGFATLERNAIYRTEIAFWQDAVTRNPANARAANNLGMAYALECRFAEAGQAFQRAIALQPEDFRARINLRLMQQGQLPGVDLRRCASPILECVSGPQANC